MSFAQDLEDAAVPEQIKKIVIGGKADDYGMDDIPDYKSFPFGRLMEYGDVRHLLNFEYASGYGTANCPPIYAWTDNFILVVSEYDGSTRITKVPRHPSIIKLPNYV